MNLKKAFGEKVKSLRTKLHLSQAELAEMIGVESLAISRIETGENFVKADTLQSIKNVFNVSYSELFKFDEVDIEESKLKSLIVHAKNLDDEALDFFTLAIKDYIKNS